MVSFESMGQEQGEQSFAEAEEHVLEPNTIYLAIHVPHNEQQQYCKEPGNRRYFKIPEAYLNRPLNEMKDVKRPIRRALQDSGIRDSLIRQRDAIQGRWADDDPYASEIVIPFVEADGTPTIIGGKLLTNHHKPRYFSQLYGKPNLVTAPDERKVKATSRGLSKILGRHRSDKT